jgi:hypothetical protein
MVEVENPYNLGANPQCANGCGDIANKYGVMCNSCFRAVYEGVTPDCSLLLIEVAIRGEVPAD